MALRILCFVFGLETVVRQQVDDGAIAHQSVRVAVDSTGKREAPGTSTSNLDSLSVSGTDSDWPSGEEPEFKDPDWPECRTEPGVCGNCWNSACNANGLCTQGCIAYCKDSGVVGSCNLD